MVKNMLTKSDFSIKTLFNKQGYYVCKVLSTAEAAGDNVRPKYFQFLHFCVYAFTYCAPVPRNSAPSEVMEQCAHKN